MTTPITLTNVNPDYYRTDVTEPGGRYPTRTMIFSTVDTLTIGRLDGAAALLEDISTAKNLTINAVNVTLATDLHIPGGDLRICCKTLRVALRKRPDGEPARTRIDLSEVRDRAYDPPHRFTPLPVAVITSPPTAGRDGDLIAQDNRSGAVDCASIPAPTPEQLYGCAGRPGGTITLICDSIILEQELLLAADGSQGFPGCDGQAGGPAAATDDPSAARKRQGGRGGRGGRGGSGGKGGAVEVRYHTIDRDERLLVQAGPGKAGEPGQPGKGGDPHGEAGAPAAPTLSAEGGEIIRVRGAARPSLGTFYDKPFLIKHLQMTKRLYLFNSPTRYAGELEFPQGRSAWDALGEQLDWMTDLLSDYATAGIDDKRPDAIAKRELYNGANNLKANHQDNLTYFGRAADWMPSAPLDTMKASFEASWASRVGIEKDFRELSTAYEKATEKQTSLDAAKVQLDRAVKAQFGKYQAVLDGLDGVPQRIQKSFIALTTASESLSAQLAPNADFSTKVVAHFGCPSIADIVKAAEMIAFTIGPEGPGAATALMTGIEAAGMISDGIKQIELNDGRKVPKANILRDVVSLSGRLKDAVAAELLVLDDDGKPIINPAQKLMLTSLDSFEDEVNNLTNEFGDVKNLVAAIENFKAALYEKGEAVVLYHLLIRRLLEEYAAYEESKRRQDALAQKTNPVDPYGTAVVSYMALLTYAWVGKWS